MIANNKKLIQLDHAVQNNKHPQTSKYWVQQPIATTPPSPPSKKSPRKPNIPMCIYITLKSEKL